MNKRKAIMIGCPQHGKLVRGTYSCDEAGNYRLGPDGEFVVERVECGHDGGRCMQTLCILHRYNRRGAGSWYPSQLLAAPETPGRSKSARPASPRPKRGEDGSTDVLA